MNHGDVAFKGESATMVEYSERLKAAMARAQVKTRTLSDAIGMSYQGVKKVIDGKSNAFSAENNSRAAAALGVSPDWLATGEGSMLHTSASDPGSASLAPPAPAEISLGQTLARLGQALERAQPQTRAAVADLLSRYAQDPAQGKSLAQAIEMLVQSDIDKKADA